MTREPAAGSASSGGAGDGVILEPARVADHLAIQDLAAAYAHALDDRDWARWEALFTSDARIDYTATGGIAGTPAEVRAWLPDAMAIFTFTLHTTATHEIRFTGADTATGRVHVFNRNGVDWDGAAEIFDVSAIYNDTYRLSGDAWRISSRIEQSLCLTGGKFAEMIRRAADDGR